MAKEAYDDMKRWWRDRLINGQKYNRLTASGVLEIEAAEIHVGHLILIETNQVPWPHDYSHARY